MAAPEHILPFGMRDLKVTAYTTGETLDPAGALDMPAARTMTFTDAEDFQELRGDDTVITRRGSGPDVSWELESGGYRAKVVKAMMGHALTSSGTSPATSVLLRRSTADVRPFFQCEGQMMSDSGGDVHGILYKARVTEDLDFELGSDGDFMVYNPQGTAFGLMAARTGTPAVPAGTIYDIVYNETVVAITGT